MVPLLCSLPTTAPSENFPPPFCFAIDLSDDLTVTAANGEDLLVTLPPLAVNGNTVVNADNDVTNGVVHIIDGVLVPSWVFNSIASRVVAASDLRTFLALVGIAGLGDDLANPGELTLVAPINSAFAKLPEGTVDFLTRAEGKVTLTRILLYHVFIGIFVFSELSDGITLATIGFTVATLQGGTVNVSVGRDRASFNDAEAVEVDILANNGVVYTIDSVLDPLTFSSDANVAPVAIDDSANTKFNTPIDIDVLENDTNTGFISTGTGTAINPASVFVIDGSITEGAKVTPNRATGMITFEPRMGFFGTAEFKYTVKDQTANTLFTTSKTSNTATVTVTVLEPPEPPKPPTPAPAPTAIGNAAASKLVEDKLLGLSSPNIAGLQDASTVFESAADFSDDANGAINNIFKGFLAASP